MPETEVFANFVERRAPVEMYVFEKDCHVKPSPKHRYSVYKRSVQWFRFWLQHVEESDPLDPDQYTRWRKLKVERENSPKDSEGLP